MVTEKQLADAARTLRLDRDGDTDIILTGLLEAVPGYIEASTGMSEEKQQACPLCGTVTGFLLRLWYYPEGVDSGKLQTVTDNLLKAISVMARQA